MDEGKGEEKDEGENGGKRCLSLGWVERKGCGGMGDGGFPLPSRPSVSFVPKLGGNIGTKEKTTMFSF